MKRRTISTNQSTTQPSHHLFVANTTSNSDGSEDNATGSSNVWYSAPLGKISEEINPDDVSAMTEPTNGYEGGGGGDRVNTVGRGGVPSVHGEFGNDVSTEGTAETGNSLEEDGSPVSMAGGNPTYTAKGGYIPPNFHVKNIV